jgi:hypothetical protein
MSLRIEQEASYIGDDRWKWAVWIEGPRELFDQIETVLWHLHHTFPDPQRWVSNSSNKFRLEASGWGEFEIHATAYNERGQPAKLHHWLRLEYPDADAGPPKETAGRTGVYLSASLTDAEIAQRLRKGLEAADFDFEVWDAGADLEIGQDWRKATEDAIARAAAVVVIVRDELSSVVEDEIRRATGMSKTVVLVVVGEVELPPAVSELQAIRVADLSELDAAIARLAELLRRKDG